MTKPEYYQIRRGRVHETVEVWPGRVLADYDRKGRLVGIEILSPDRNDFGLDQDGQTGRLADR